MNAPARALTIEPILTTAKGEPPQHGMGKFFRDDQGEVVEPHNPNHRSHAARVGVLELDDGQWLAHDRGFGIDNPIFPTRDQALRCSIARAVKRFRRMRADRGDGEIWSEGIAGRMVEWALSLKPSREGKPVDGPDSVTVAPEPRSASDRDAPEQINASHDSAITDPVVAELVTQHKARKTFPAGHIVHMTLDYSNADNVRSVGTCDCGAVFVFSQAQHARMDAAVEAHWQRFDDLPDKVDVKGQPIKQSENGAIAPSPACADSSAPQPPAHAGSIAESDAMRVPSLASPEPAVTDHGTPAAGSPLSDDDDEWLSRAAEALRWRDEDEVSKLPPLLVAARNGIVERPILRWHGGKWKLAPWIMGFFPDHRIYVEPFGGAGSVLMRKSRVYAEIYNDLDDVVVNLFRVLRDDAKACRLIEALRSTPFAREEFTAALEVAEDDVERARHLIVRSYMGFGSNAHAGSSTAEKTGFKGYTRPDDYRSTGFRANSNRSGTTPAHDWANYPDALPAIVDRLRGVIVEQRPAIDVMKQHDGGGTLHYVDPPCLPETRSPANKYDLKHRMYRHELTADDHRELLTFLRTLRGFVVLSGYPSPLYDEALPDWRRVSCAAHADGARDRTEVLWLNPACTAALDQQHPALFDLFKFDESNAPLPSN